MSVYKQGQDKRCGNCSMSMEIKSEQYRVVCDVHSAVFNVLGWCSKWKPELEHEPDPEKSDSKIRLTGIPCSHCKHGVASEAGHKCKLTDKPLLRTGLFLCSVYEPKEPEPENPKVTIGCCYVCVSSDECSKISKLKIPKICSNFRPRVWCEHTRVCKYDTCCYVRNMVSDKVTEKPKEPEKSDEYGEDVNFDSEPCCLMCEERETLMKKIKERQEAIETKDWIIEQKSDLIDEYNKIIEKQKKINERLRKKIDHICRAVFSSYKDYR